MATFLWRRALPLREQGNDMVRISSSRMWTLAQIEDLSGTYRSRFDGCKCGCGIEAFNYGRSSEGAKSWDAVSDDR